MKPSDIVFYKKHLGTSKFCTKNEQKATKIMTILSRDFVTERIAPAFIMKDYHEFESADFNFDWARFNLVNKTKNELKIEAVFSDSADVYGIVEFRTGAGLEVNNKKCRGAIIIDYPNDPKGNNIKKKSVESFAFCVGMYMLAFLDGDWDRPLRKYAEELNDTPDNTQELQAVLDKLNEQLKKQQESFETEKREYNILISRLEYQVRENNKRITSLKSHLKTISNMVQQIEEAPAPEYKEEDTTDYVALLKEKIKNQKICIVGGTDAWKAKIIEEFTNTMILDSKNFSASKMDNCQILVINTNYVGHDITTKAQTIAFAKNMRVVYTSKTNIQKFAEEILFSLT